MIDKKSMYSYNMSIENKRNLTKQKDALTKCEEMYTGQQKM